MSSADDKKRKREEKAARRAERDAKKAKKGPPEVEPPPRFLGTVSDASTSASTSSVPASQASGQATNAPSQPSSSNKANPNPQRHDPAPAPALNSDPVSDDTVVDKGSDPQERPRRVRILQGEAPTRQRKLKKVLATMENDRRTQMSTKSIKEHHMAARLVNRVVNPFMDSHNALSFGIALNSTNVGTLESDTDEDGSDLEDDADEDDNDDDEEKLERRARKMQEQQLQRERRELVYQFNELLRLIPDLKTDIELFNDEQLLEYSRYLDYSIHSARQDDTGHLTDRAIQYLPYSAQGPKAGEAPGMIVKCLRGWRNYFTARQLCPFDMLDNFEADWEQFCEDIMDGKRVITPGDFCAFLYCQSEAETGGSSDAGLLRGPFFLACYKSLWTGPSSALLISGRKAKTPGKPPIAWSYKLSAVTPRSLAYTAVLVRHALMPEEFATTDAFGFNYHQFFNEILSLFKDPTSAWCKETIAWWNSKVFANSPYAKSQPAAGIGRLTTAERIRKERKAAKKGKQVTRT